MDPMLLKQLGDRQLEELRHSAAHQRDARASAGATEPAPRGGSVVAALRRTTGGALISAGVRLRGEPRAF